MTSIVRSWKNLTVRAFSLVLYDRCFSLYPLLAFVQPKIGRKTPQIEVTLRPFNFQIGVLLAFLSPRPFDFEPLDDTIASWHVGVVTALKVQK